MRHETMFLWWWRKDLINMIGSMDINLGLNQEEKIICKTGVYEFVRPKGG